MMTKKEQAERDKLIRELALARALSWPMFPMPEPVGRLVSKGVQRGWGIVAGKPRQLIYSKGWTETMTDDNEVYASRDDALKAHVWRTAIKAAEMMARAIQLLNEGE